jgi:hypothetical protein
MHIVYRLGESLSVSISLSPQKPQPYATSIQYERMATRHLQLEEFLAHVIRALQLPVHVTDTPF